MKFVGEIFLYIFRFIVEMNLPPGIGKKKEDANLMNGVAIVSLVQALILDNIYVIYTLISNAKYRNSYWLAAVLMIGIIYLNYRWLISCGYGISYVQNYRIERTAYRYIVKSSAFIIVTFAVLGVIFIYPSH